MDTTPNNILEQLGRDGLVVMWFSIFTGSFLLLFLVYLFIYTVPCHRQDGDKKNKL